MHPREWAVFAACAAVSSAWCLWMARQTGATFDEPFYLDAGLDYWRTGRFRELLSAGVMPLPAHLQTLPLYLSGRQWSLAADLGEMLPLARSVTLLFWWTLLFYAWRLARMAGGAAAAAAAVALIAIEPNFLAHASLATTDIALTATILAFTFHYVLGIGQNWRWRVGVPAVALAVAIAAKASAIAIGPAIMAAIVLHRAAATADRRVRRDILDALVILAAGTALAVLYCGAGGSPSFQGTLAAMPPEHPLRPVLAWIGALPLFPNGLYALWFQFEHGVVGQPVFVAGVADGDGVWFYLPLLLSIKLTLPLILLTIAALAVAPSRGRDAVLGIVALAFVMALVRVQTGIRFVLPFLALLVIWIGIRLAPVVHHQLRSTTRFAGIALLAAAMGTALAQSSPDSLRYTNEFWGATAEGYRYVSDSNYDWGQGLPELAQWQANDGVPLSVWYFGTDPRFPHLTRVEPRRPEFRMDDLRGRRLAVSMSILYGGYVRSGPAFELVMQLRAMQPIDRTRTFLIYDADRIR